MTEKFESIATKGVLSKEDLSGLPGVPSKERLKKGPVAVIECAQEIPCNPCETACPQGAIRVGENINSLPLLDEDECTGCGLCVPACPGLAIRIIELNYSEKEALVKLPHEFLPVPSKHKRVKCLNREGKIISDGKVIKALNPKTYDRTYVLFVIVPKQVAEDVIAIKGG